MPRAMAPPPSNEINIMLTQPFTGTNTTKIEIYGEPNKSASIKLHKHTGGKQNTMMTTVGDIKHEDFDELLGGVQQLRGLPTDPSSDIYGFDTRVALTTFDIQWDNGDDVEGAEPTEENKQAFKEIADKIEELARKYAKKDAAI